MIFRELRRPLAALATLLPALAAHAQAQDDGGTPPTGGMVGVAVGDGPRYLGSAKRRVGVLPVIGYRWDNGWSLGFDGIAYRFVDTPGFEYGVGLGWDMGRKENRSSELKGLGNVDASPELRVFGRWKVVGNLAADAELRYGAGNDHDGLQLRTGLKYGLEVAPRWRMAGSVSATFANGRYMQDYFGVNATQSAASGYAAYDAGSGLRDVRLGLSLAHPITPDWALTMGVEQIRLQGSAKDSPLDHERNPFALNLTLGRRF